MEDSRMRICPICGKEFLLLPEWCLTDYNEKPVCSPHCNHIAYEKKYGDKKELRGEKTYENMLKRHKRYQEKKRNGEVKPKKNARFMKPVLAIKKEDGSTMARYESVNAAAEATGKSASEISKVCRGVAKMSGKYTFIYEKEEHRPKEGHTVFTRESAFKSVVQLDQRGNFIARFNSQSEAAEATGCYAASISSCCNHKQHITKGFVFMFESEYEKGKQK